MTAAAPEPAPDRELIEAALAARSRAYAPYSKFLVGAAVRGDNGRVYSGVNVENASYGLTVCAERVAMQTAVAEGVRRVLAVAVATRGGGSPCGACRQVLWEFGDPATVVWLVDAERPERFAAHTLAELLPAAFRLTPGT